MVVLFVGDTNKIGISLSNSFYKEINVNTVILLT